jgi:hypothetical protein
MKKFILLGLLAMFSITSSFAYIAEVNASTNPDSPYYTGFQTKTFSMNRYAVGYYFEASGDAWANVSASFSDNTSYYRSIRSKSGGANNYTHGTISKSGARVTWLLIEATAPTTWNTTGSAMCQWTW